MDWMAYIIKIPPIPKTIYDFNKLSIKIPKGFLHKNFFKIHINSQPIRKNKNSLKRQQYSKTIYLIKNQYPQYKNNHILTMTRPHNLIYKQTKEFNRHLSKEDIQMTTQHMK